MTSRGLGFLAFIIGAAPVLVVLALLGLLTSHTTMLDLSNGIQEFQPYMRGVILDLSGSASSASNSVQGLATSTWNSIGTDTAAAGTSLVESTSRLGTRGVLAIFAWVVLSLAVGLAFHRRSQSHFQFHL